MGYNNSYGGNYAGQQRQDPKTKILYGLMKEIQRMNALKALELRFQIDENFKASVEDVDDIMNTDPAGRYTNRPPEED